jgi:hypothetical protein
MIKQSIAIFLLIAFVTQTFSSGFVVLDYFTNTAAFAKNCVNKAKPKLHCNGKCQMMKKLQEEEKKDQQMPERKSETKIDLLSFTASFPSINRSFVAIAGEQTSFQYNVSLSKMPRSIFRPPSL